MSWPFSKKERIGFLTKTPDGSQERIVTKGKDGVVSEVITLNEPKDVRVEPVKLEEHEK